VRYPSAYIQRRGELDVTMTPMIDVVFLLLVFFIWTASFQIAEHILPSNLASAPGQAIENPLDEPPPEADFDNVVVHIELTGGVLQWRVNETPVATLAALKARLDLIAQIKSDAPVILDPDSEVSIGDVIDVYDISRLAGFEKVQFAASEQV
jgi:biopolymer transport protein ExbD